MSLIPEKRLDKHNRLVTRHVLAAPHAKSTNLPAPVSEVAPKNALKPKIRPSQKKPNPYVITMELEVNDLLITPEDIEQGGTYYAFSASEEEAYAVLGCTENVSDALHMLSCGVRTADEAYGFLEEHGAEHLAVDNSALMSDLLARNVGYCHYVDHHKRLLESYPDTERLADLIELNTIRPLKSQCRSAEPYIADGSVSLADIKALGVNNLKDQERLIATIGALTDLNQNPDTKISLDDIAWIMEKSALSFRGDRSREYAGAVTALVGVGREAIEPIQKFSSLATLLRHYERRESPDYVSKAVYAAIVLEVSSSRLTDDIDLLFDSDIDPHDAGAMMLKGMTVERILDARDNGIASSVNEGWL